ncbi:unnamed protein product [Amoebophrya sp. A120]|nr:unnamed protein product [Amoebophrya sp. A120]|eukprot:GSA120T00012958001.1
MTSDAGVSKSKKEKKEKKSKKEKKEKDKNSDHPSPSASPGDAAPSLPPGLAAAGLAGAYPPWGVAAAPGWDPWGQGWHPAAASGHHWAPHMDPNAAAMMAAAAAHQAAAAAGHHLVPPHDAANALSGALEKALSSHLSGSSERKKKKKKKKRRSRSSDSEEESSEEIKVRTIANPFARYGHESQPPPQQGAQMPRSGDYTSEKLEAIGIHENPELVEGLLEWVDENRIDQDAFVRLRCLTVEYQHKIMVKGPVGDVANPANVLIARIRDMLKHPILGAPRPGKKAQPTLEEKEHLEDMRALEMQARNNYQQENQNQRMRQRYDERDGKGGKRYDGYHDRPYGKWGRAAASPEVIGPSLSEQQEKLSQRGGSGKYNGGKYGKGGGGRHKDHQRSIGDYNHSNGGGASNQQNLALTNVVDPSIDARHAPQFVPATAAQHSSTFPPGGESVHPPHQIHMGGAGVVPPAHQQQPGVVMMQQHQQHSMNTEQPQRESTPTTTSNGQAMPYGFGNTTVRGQTTPRNHIHSNLPGGGGQGHQSFATNGGFVHPQHHVLPHDQVGHHLPQHHPPPMAHFGGPPPPEMTGPPHHQGGYRAHQQGGYHQAPSGGGPYGKGFAPVTFADVRGAC